MPDRTDKPPLGKSPVSLDIYLQRSIKCHLLRYTPVRVLTAGMADEDNQLITVLLLELDILGIRNLCILETVYHHKVGSFLTFQAKAQLIQWFSVQQQETTVYL